MMRLDLGPPSNAKRSGGLVPMSCVGMPMTFAGKICSTTNPTTPATTASLRSFFNRGDMGRP